MNEEKQGMTEPQEAAELYERFLDSRYVRERREILQKMKQKNCLTEKMLSDFAVTMDVMLSAGDLEDKYYDLLRCMDTMAKFETTGLR